MSIVTRMHCDGCNREQPWMCGFKDTTPPAGWMTLWDTDRSGEDTEAYHFCSPACLLAWVNRTRHVAHHLVPVPVEAS